MNTTLTIGGTSYTAAQRAAAQIELDFWSWDLDDDLEAEFHETRVGASIGPRFHCGQSVTVAVNTGGGNVTRFTGEIIEVIPQFTNQGWVYAYRCAGPKYQANQLWSTGTDGTGLIVFNLPPDDPEYVPANSGLSVGTIIGNLLTLHSTALSALSITTDATTTSQLAALTVVPNAPVYITGRLIHAIDDLLAEWARNVVCHISASGKFRFYDTTAASTTLTLTMNLDPIDPVCLSRSTHQCASRVVVRGKGKIYPGYVSLGRSTLTRAWSGANQTAWKYTDFTHPTDAFDKGTVNSVDSPTQVTLHSSDATRTWATNFWNTREAWIYLSSSIGSALTYTEARPVTACASLSAGGTATVTMGFDLENAGVSAYDQYELIGKVADLASGGLNNVWRLYDVTDPGGQIANHMVAKFPAQVPFMNYSGTAESLTWYPIATIVQGLNAWPATFKVMPLTGQILFDEPVVKPFNSMPNLNAGGGSVTAPDDIYCLLAYSRGALSSTYPPDSMGSPVYNGTSYTADGISRTLYLDVENWVYQGNQSLMDQYAQMIWQSTSDTVVTGSVSYRGAYTAAFGPDLKLNIAGDGFTTGMESVGVPIRAFTLRYHADGSAGLNYSSQLRCSSRRNPRTGETIYLHTTQLNQAGFKLNFGGALDMSGLGRVVADNWASSLPNTSAGSDGADLGPIWMGTGNGVRSKAGNRGSYAAAREKWQKGVTPSEDADGTPNTFTGTDNKTHTFTGAEPSRRKRNLTTAQARKEWQQGAAQRMAQRPVTADDVGQAVGVNNVEGEPNGTRIPASTDGKPHTFTGFAAPRDQQARIARNRQARQPRPITRQQAIDRSQKSIADRRSQVRQQKYQAMEARTRRRDKADAPHDALRNRYANEDQT